MKSVEGFDIDDIIKLQQRIRGLEAELITAKTKIAVMDGEHCAKNRAEGRGSCGACSWCCKQAEIKAEKLSVRVGMAIKAIEKSEDARSTILYVLEILNGY